MVKQHIRTMAYLAQTALLITACNGDDTAASSATETTTGTATESSATTNDSATSGSTTNTSEDSTSSTSSATSSTTEPETTTGETDSTTGGDAADAFRFTEMFVRDPHFFITPILGCEDITDKGILGSPAINEQFNEAIVTDLDPQDGFLNMSFMLLFRPLDQAAANGSFEFATGDCTAPIESSSCEIKAGTEAAAGKYTNLADVCLEPIPGELSSANYEPKPGSATGPCFRGDPLSFTLDLGDFKLPFTDAEIAAQYVGDPADGMVEGVIHGFLTEEDGNNTILPEDIPLLGGNPISSVLPGGEGNCAEHDDRDMHMGVSGWWFYIDFKAARVEYTGE